MLTELFGCVLVHVCVCAFEWMPCVTVPTKGVGFPGARLTGNGE